MSKFPSDDDLSAPPPDRVNPIERARLDIARRDAGHKVRQKPTGEGVQKSPYSKAFKADDPANAETGPVDIDRHSRQLIGRKIVAGPLTGRPLIGRPPTWRSLSRKDGAPLARAEDLKKRPTQAFGIPQLPSSADLPSTTLPDATVTTNELPRTEPPKEEEKASDAPEKRKKRRAKPEIDLAVIDKIVREGGRFLTEREVAAHLHFAASSLRNGRGADKDKWPKALKFGRSIRFDPADVREFVERGRK